MLYWPLKARPRTVPQIMGAGALSETETTGILRELAVLGVAERKGDFWKLSDPG